MKARVIKFENVWIIELVLRDVENAAADETFDQEAAQPITQYWAGDWNRDVRSWPALKMFARRFSTREAARAELAEIRKRKQI